MKTPELLAPGGSFLSAHAAFEAGADGVYLGLKEFSARAAAQNFSRDQLRRIRALAADRDRRIYVTVNTVIRDDELDRLRRTLAWLDALRVDGVIVQDLGVCDLLAREFPRLPLHASTQMGIHNDSGLRVAEEMGVRRAILSRELPLERIRALRQRHPGIELEVFIHGALCYSFSGSCLASWALTGRSGNRGECAQVCRSRFTSSEGRDGHLFSTRDLFLGREVLELARIGVDALKIEGRMKSPEYVFHVTRLYREVLDQGDALTPARYEQLLRNAELGFSRRHTTGWFHSRLGTELLETGAPGHRGAVLGTVRGVSGRLAEVRLEGDISVRDGAGWVLPGGSEMAAFSVQSLFQEGKPVRFARRGQVVEIEVPVEAAPGMPAPGQEIRHLSSRFLDLPQPRETSFALFKIPVDMGVRLETDGRLEVTAAGFPPFVGQVSVLPARTRRPFAPLLSSLLQESGDSELRPGSIAFENQTGLPDDGIFVRPAELKKLKNELYEHLDHELSARTGGGEPSAAIPGTPAAPEPSPLTQSDLSRLSRRELLSPPGQAPVPFAGIEPAPLAPDALAQMCGFRWVPLPPVILDDSAWIEALRHLARHNPASRFAIGLNNVSHLAVAQALAADPNVWYFADFFLYAANRATVDALVRRIPRLLFAYEWLEAGSVPGAGGAASFAAPVPLLRIAQGFPPPLFVSLACITRHAAGGGHCREDCPRELTGELRQGRHRFRLVVRDCVTYLFRQ
ncbi:MAG TPA: peptidase U32 family protein [Spirochaetia bacterium]|nr:peptidase U32 family protein [Spirochaetia bacterium]